MKFQRFFLWLFLLFSSPAIAQEFTFSPPLSSPLPVVLTLPEPVPAFAKSVILVSDGYISDFSLILDRALPKGLYRQAKFKVYFSALPVSLSFGAASVVIGVASTPSPSPTIIASPTYTPTPIASSTYTPAPTGTPIYVYLFGSSTIANWSSAAADLAPHIVARHGESGAKLYNLAKVPLRYIGTFPAEVFLVYAGSNDLAENKTPASVLASFQLLVQNIRASRSELVIGFISMIPTATSGRTLQDVVDTNALIKSYCDADGGLIFIDTHSSMLLSDGSPNPYYISGDNKHMNRAGYALTGSIIKDVLSGF